MCLYLPRPIGHPKSFKVMADVDIQEKVTSFETSAMDREKFTGPIQV